MAEKTEMAEKTPNGKVEALLTCKCGRTKKIGLSTNKDQDTGRWYLFLQNTDMDEPEWYVDMDYDYAIVRCPDCVTPLSRAVWGD